MDIDNIKAEGNLTGINANGGDVFLSRSKLGRNVTGFNTNTSGAVVSFGNNQIHDQAAGQLDESESLQ